MQDLMTSDELVTRNPPMSQKKRTRQPLPSPQPSQPSQRSIPERELPRMEPVTQCVLPGPI